MNATPASPKARRQRLSVDNFGSVPRGSKLSTRQTNAQIKQLRLALRGNQQDLGQAVGELARSDRARGEHLPLVLRP